MSKINWKGITADTVARTVALAIALLNQVFAILGKGTIDIADEQIYQIVSIIFTVATSVIAWWKNNSFTHEAKQADEVLKQLKADKNKVGSEQNADTEDEHVALEPDDESEVE